jgi:opacity protein-like surface antigen
MIYMKMNWLTAALAGAALTPAAFAQEKTPAPAPHEERAYFTLSLGSAGATDFDYQMYGYTNTDDVKSGVAVSGAWGVRFSPHVRAEAELSYRGQDITTSAATPAYLQQPPFNQPAITHYPQKGRLEAYGIGTNVYYDFATKGVARPFLGAGVGYEYVNVDDVYLDGHADALQAQLIGGARFPITSTLLFSVDVRYTYLGHVGIDNGSNVQKADMSSVGANAGLVFDF